MKRSRRISACTGALLSLLSPLAPWSARADAPRGPEARTSTALYRVGPEDVLRVRVARHETLGGEVVVLQDGRVVLPVVGSLTVSGLTVEEIRAQVVKGLRKKLVNPEVSVEVARPRPQRIFVSGAVKAAQPLDLKEGWRITEALAHAGGLTLRPELARGTLFRLPDQTITLNLSQIYVEQNATANLRLQPGDVIDVQEAPTVRIYVNGQVNNPGIVDLYRGRGVVDALAQAKGPTATAALSKSYVVKADGRKIPVNLARLINNQTDAPSDLKLEAGDQLVVPENLTKVAIYGMVMQPGVFPLHDDQEMTVAEAISLAQGFDKRAQKSKIGIIRIVDGKQTILTIDMHRFSKAQAPNITLQDRDIVFVPESRKPDWTGKILPGLQALTGALWYAVGR
jgi:protein involved in polysaccharide export with SLBB domain